MKKILIGISYALLLSSAALAQLVLPGAGGSSGGGGTPGGVSTDVQCNVTGAFGACSTGNFTSDGSGNVVAKGTLQVGTSANERFTGSYAGSNSFAMYAGGTPWFVVTTGGSNINPKLPALPGWVNGAWNGGNMFVIGGASAGSGNANRAADPLGLYTGMGTGNGLAAYMSFNVAGTGTAGSTLNNYVEAARAITTGFIVKPVLYSQTAGAAPALTSCGGGTPAVLTGSTDMAGEVTEGTSISGCTVTMAATTYGQKPSCVVTPQTESLVTAFNYTIGFSSGTVTITVTNVTGSGFVFNYNCTYFS